MMALKSNFLNKKELSTKLVIFQIELFSRGVPKGKGFDANLGGA